MTLLDEKINTEPDRQEQKVFGGLQEGWTAAKTIEQSVKTALKLFSTLLGKNTGAATPHLSIREISQQNEESLDF